jgi:hypothetical protein
MSTLATTKLILARLMYVIVGLLLTTLVSALETGYGQEQYSFVTQ